MFYEYKYNSIKIIILIIIYPLFLYKQNVTYIENDNKMREYEGNIDFSQKKTNIKVIALYLPQFHEIDENNNFWGKGFTEWINVKKCKPSFIGHHQPRIPGDKFGYLNYYDLTDLNVIKSQVKLAMNHGIYGFGIYYYWFSGKQLLEKPLNLFIKYSDINFHFLLIWANENWTKKWDGKDSEILIKQEYKPKDPIIFIRDIKKYIIDKRYIKIDEKPVLGLYEPNKIPNLKEVTTIWRQKSREYGIGEIFILICINNNKTQDFQNLNLFNATYEFPPRNSFQNHRIPNKKTFIYSELLYKSLYLDETKADFNLLPFFRGSMLEWDNCPRMNKCEIFDHYSPQQFYLFNKIIINWTNRHYNKDFRFIFINAWNEWGEGSYLEPDEKYGYASINSLSKAIFNLTYIQTYNLTDIIGKNKIIVFVFCVKENLIGNIIEITNNIPFKFDLALFMENNINMNTIKQYIKINSKTINFELETSFNIKKNLFKFQNKIKNYKYICNINYNPYKNISIFKEWRNYIHNNLLGDSLIISEIINDFENNDDLGMIFPERYYKTLSMFGENINNFETKYLNSVLNKVNPKVRISPKFIDFPEGNMFWARTKAIYPLFNLISNILFTKKMRLIVENHLEKIWIYLLKLNGFFYKKIFKHL